MDHLVRRVGKDIVLVITSVHPSLHTHGPHIFWLGRTFALRPEASGMILLLCLFVDLFSLFEPRKGMKIG